VAEKPPGNAHLARVLQRFWDGRRTSCDPVFLINDIPQGPGLVKHPGVPMYSLGTAPRVEVRGGWSDPGPVPSVAGPHKRRLSSGVSDTLRRTLKLPAGMSSKETQCNLQSNYMLASPVFDQPALLDRHLVHLL